MINPEVEPLPSVPDKWNKALDDMRDTVFLASQKHQQQHQRALREGAHPGIVGLKAMGITGFEQALIGRMAKLGVPMFATEVHRTADRQNLLYREGKSRAQAGEGPHGYGCAVDIVHGTRAWALTDQQWAIVGHVGKQIVLPHGWKVEWGGDWKFYDPAHWEIVGWRDVKAILDRPWTAERVVIEQMMAKRSQT